MPLAFLAGVRWGPIGMAWAWLAAFPLVAIYTARIAMPILGVGPRALCRAVAPGLLASLGMAAIVALLDRSMPFDTALARLATLVVVGVAAYALLVLLLARATLVDIWWLIRRRGVA